MFFDGTTLWSSIPTPNNLTAKRTLSTVSSHVLLEGVGTRRTVTTPRAIAVEVSHTSVGENVLFHSTQPCTTVPTTGVNTIMFVWFGTKHGVKAYLMYPSALWLGAIKAILLLNNSRVGTLRLGAKQIVNALLI